MNAMRLLGLVVILALVFGAGAWWQQNRQSRSLSDLTWYRANYLRQQGFTVGFGQYELYSLDGGKNWFSVQRIGADGIQSIGPADPKLLAQLKAFDALIQKV